MTEPGLRPSDLSGTLGSLPAIPNELEALEAGLVARRRTAAGITDESAPKAGLALSGGGIRSATFSLGVLQAFAKHGLLRRFDWLSTVSGGGYVGSFLGRLYTRTKEELIGALPRIVRPSADTKLTATDLVERILAEPQSKPLSFLRENGRYLSPNGAGDLLLAGAVALRNTVSIHVAFGSLLLALLLLLEAAGVLRGDALVTAALFALLGATAAGVLYWLGQPVLRLLRDPYPARRFNNLLSRVMLFFLVAGLAVLVLAGVGFLTDFVHRRLASGLPLRDALNGLFGAGGLFAGLRALFKRLPSGGGPPRIPVELLAGAGALVLTLFVVTSWATLAVVISSRSGGSIWRVVAAAFVLTFLLGRTVSFLNQSSLQALYGARLSRAYLGASNPKRWSGSGQNVTEPFEGDGAPLDAYRPHEAGGPLHIVNVTLNETVAGKSQVEQRDRKGLAMAVGPLAVSAGKRSHALREPSEAGRFGLRPLEPSKSEYAIFTSTAGDRLTAESLPIETWVAVSGAAFSTGLGSRTSLGLSLLCGIFNIRLGYWWDSGVSPAARRGVETSPGLGGTAWRLFDLVLPVQSHLLDEFLARFRGPNSRRWYLSDGGHFENTACYELIRRRTPVIVLCDDGADPDYQFGDLANLARKARLDFCTEITFLEEADLADEPAGRFFGSLSQLRREPADGFARKHAALAWIRYPDGSRGVLVVLKPTLTGDEPLDLLEYRSGHDKFPQEPTSDQFFDEAQWESYRKLGEVVGARFCEALGGRPLSPETLLGPASSAGRPA